MGGIKCLSSEEQKQWAVTLFPQTSIETVGGVRRRDETRETDAATAAQQRGVAEPTAAMDVEASGFAHPLKGIRFPPMAASGPSNLRAEDLSE